MPLTHVGRNISGRHLQKNQIIWNIFVSMTSTSSRGHVLVIYAGEFPAIVSGGHNGMSS